MRTLAMWTALALSAGTGFAAESGGAAETGGAAAEVDYATRVKPVLTARCTPCHGALKQEGGLRLDTAAALLRGGESGPAGAAGNGAGLLLERVSAADEQERMPPEGEPLKPAEIADLRAWLTAGAKAPADERPERDPRDHWAFRTPVKPPVPIVADPARNANPIDAFLAAAWTARGLKPQPEADKRVWLRRVTLDLIGLPPTREEIDAFVADDSAEAYERVADRLLASPHYGERWGRHWMDIWRYSDWWGLGAEVRSSQKHIRHWRDWIIESNNADVGYDEMLRQMLAADELYPTEAAKLRATGFLARQYFKFNRTTWLDGTVEHTSKAFLGLTYNCAKCHDHKYDPISQEDYHRLRAIFEPYQVRTDLVPGEPDFERDGIPRAFDCNLDAKTPFHIRGDERNADPHKTILPGLPPFLAGDDFRIEPIALPPEAHRPGLRPEVAETHRAAAEKRAAAARTAVAAAENTLDAARLRSAVGEEPPLEGPAAGKSPSAVPSVEQAEILLEIARAELLAARSHVAAIPARAAAEREIHNLSAAPDRAEIVATAVRLERTATAADAEVAVRKAELELLKAPADKRGPAEKKLAAAVTARDKARREIEVAGTHFTPLRGALKSVESNLESEASRDKPFPTHSTGRRAAFARRLTDPRHPLTARVAVNHIWGRHFGRPLVATTFDFGRHGSPPSRPELLDFLACDFVEHGWSMKRLHRLIVTSRTYRLSSSRAGADPATEAADPDNLHLWRMNPVRMESQVVRDSLLFLAGELDPTLGGPSIPAGDEGSRRRSVYFVHSHNESNKFLAMFDDANVLECYRRSESIVPQQALALENSTLALSAAEKIAARIAAARPDLDDAAFARAAFLVVLGTEPHPAEIELLREALPRLTAAAVADERPDPHRRARVRAIHALLNHNDFVTIR